METSIATLTNSDPALNRVPLLRWQQSKDFAHLSFQPKCHDAEEGTVAASGRHSTYCTHGALHLDCASANAANAARGARIKTDTEYKMQNRGGKEMSGSCFRSSPHHGRRANGALVMMVLSKGIEESIFDARSYPSAAWRWLGKLAMICDVVCLIFCIKKREKEKEAVEICRPAAL